jgi:hypothetical protein
LAHPIPTDVDAVKALASAPAVLDLFMWLVYRCFIAKREEQIPLFGNFTQADITTLPLHGGKETAGENAETIAFSFND